MAPDRSELNYHAGIAVRSHGVIEVTVKHCGVQFIESEEDILLAGLVFHACYQPESDLSKVRYKPHVLLQEIQALMTDEVTYLSTQNDKKGFCSTTTDNIELLCVCQTPWIEGTTSKAIYGTQQKEFIIHVCCKCARWYHNHCLHVCGIPVPKRTHDFFCPKCYLPPTIPWMHSKYTNTCTSDNFLTTLLLYSSQNSMFLTMFGLSKAEQALKSGLSTMLTGDIHKGKTTILDFIHSKLTLKRTGKKFDCFGSENSMCLQFFHHVWKLAISNKCNSSHCPSPKSERCVVEFTLHPTSKCDISIAGQIKHIFPISGHFYGYCGAAFPHEPPSNAPHAESDREDVTTNKRSTFYECRGTPIVQSAAFLSSRPWIIPFNIASFEDDEMVDVIEELPKEIVLYGIRYELAGYSIVSRKHITAVIIWRGELYFYDGLGVTDQVRLKPLDKKNLIHKGQTGSYVYYLLSTRN